MYHSGCIGLAISSQDGTNLHREKSEINLKIQMTSSNEMKDNRRELTLLTGKQIIMKL